MRVVLQRKSLCSCNAPPPVYATGAREIERVRSGGERKRVLENQNETNKPANLYLFILFVLTFFKKKNFNKIILCIQYVVIKNI